MLVLALLVGAVLSSCWLLAAPPGAQSQEVFDQPPAAVPLRPTHRPAQTISADLLRHPLSYKTRGMLQRAVDWMRSGKHKEAIHQLEDTLAKDPASAPYVHSLLGYEFMQTDQFAEAVKCFEQAVALLPHDAINRANYGISLAASGDLEGAKEQARRAHELDPDNPGIQRFLDAMQAYEPARVHP